MRMGKRVTTILVIGIFGQLLFPILTFTHAISASRSWVKLQEVITGNYISDVTGLPKDPVDEMLMGIALFVIGYLACYLAALVIIPMRINRRSDGIGLLSILLLVGGSALLLVATVQSSFVVAVINDRLLSGFTAPNSLGMIIILHFLVLALFVSYFARHFFRPAT